MNFTETNRFNSTNIEKILTGLILYSLTLWTFMGNLFILIAVTTNKQLKQNGTSNMLIGNLALSDLLLSLTVMPLSATFITFKHWFFGQITCQIWMSFDVLCSTASIWGLLVIAMDRYKATNHPLKYRLEKNNSKFGIIYIGTAWTISITISLGSFLFHNNYSNQCVLFHMPIFVVSSSIVSFFLPLTFMVILYSKVNFFLFYF